jgi:hypothetical protein
LLTRQGLRVLPALMAVWALFAAHDAAKADVISSFSVNLGTIDAGQQSTLDLTLTAVQDPTLCPYTVGPTCGGSHVATALTGGSVTLYSGTGLSQSFTISTDLTDPATENFQFSFTYPTPGTFTPSYQFTADYQETLNSVLRATPTPAPIVLSL